MAYESLGRLKSVTTGIFVISLVVGFFVKHDGIFGGQFASGLFQKLAFHTAHIDFFSLPRAVVSFFIHSDLIHLLTGFMFILPFGIYVEGKVSAFRYLVFCLASHLASVLAQTLSSVLISSGAGYFVVGSSGVAFALVGASVVLGKMRFTGVAVFLGLIYFLFAGDIGFGHAGHMAGFLFGFVVAALGWLVQNPKAKEQVV